ncbi:MAG: ribulokinase [Gaiellaceae bacterium]
MSDRRFAVGLDFGTESGRAVLVDCDDGAEVSAAVYTYENGVVDEHLPDSGVELEPDWALQDPADYIRTLQHAVPEVIAGVHPEQVVGIGIDFTSCTMLPTTADGTPLCELADFRRRPHAWVKLWKHHAAQPEADEVNAVALQSNEPWLERYGGKISSEWFFPKALQILREDPGVYDRADRLIEAADWLVWQLTGTETRNNTTAGYKAIWSRADGFPVAEYFASLDPAFTNVVDEKMSRRIDGIGSRAGGLTDRAAAWTGLAAGTPVAVANVDAHVSAPAVGCVEPGVLVIIMGTSNCHILLADRLAVVEGMCGVVKDGVVPGLFGYEAGQSAVGDIFAWFVENSVPPETHDLARMEGVDVHRLLERQAAELVAGEHGLLALDWWNGNRSVLVDAGLSGLVVGLTLSTRPHHLYRALMEATAFGTRVIVDAFEQSNLPVHRVIACGGLPQRNRLLMQIYSDVLARPIEVAGSQNAPALGSAMFGAVVGGAYDSIREASVGMAPRAAESYVPNDRNRAAYDALYAEYVRLHDYFGRDGDDAMRVLKRLRDDARLATSRAPLISER